MCHRAFAAGDCFCLVALFYVWTVSSNNEPWGWGEKQRDYYNRLLHGFINGHLYMNTRVPEELLKLDDPQKRPRAWDCTMPATTTEDITCISERRRW